jgi:hypothetical protein
MLTARAAKALAKAPGAAEGILATALSEQSNQALLPLSAQLKRRIAELQTKNRQRAP